MMKRQLGFAAAFGLAYYHQTALNARHDRDFDHHRASRRIFVLFSRRELFMPTVHLSRHAHIIYERFVYRAARQLYVFFLRLLLMLICAGRAENARLITVYYA